MHALASELGLEIFETNASDNRTAELLEKSVGSAAAQASLFSKGKILLVDEIDGLDAKEDRGGVAALSKIIGRSVFPVVLTANNPWNSKFSQLRLRSELIEFGAISPFFIYGVLKKICEHEKIKYEEAALKKFAAHANGDLRAAINDLQALSAKPISSGSIAFLSERDAQLSMFKALTRVFKSAEPVQAVSAFDNVEENIDRCFLWVDENLPKEYTQPAELAAAYDA
ncbi:unnamed protein product, partial [marine sediment metagenome]